MNYELCTMNCLELCTMNYALKKAHLTFMSLQFPSSNTYSKSFNYAISILMHRKQAIAQIALFSAILKMIPHSITELVIILIYIC